LTSEITGYFLSVHGNTKDLSFDGLQNRLQEYEKGIVLRVYEENTVYTTQWGNCVRRKGTKKESSRTYSPKTSRDLKLSLSQKIFFCKRVKREKRAISSYDAGTDPFKTKVSLKKVRTWF
jgi:hypothetical protein